MRKDLGVSSVVTPVGVVAGLVFAGTAVAKHCGEVGYGA